MPLTKERTDDRRRAPHPRDRRGQGRPGRRRHPHRRCARPGDRLLGVGHNRRVQLGSAIRHGETDCLENVGRLPATVYSESTMATTLSPCDMCTGAILPGHPAVVVGENKTFYGGEDYLRSRGVEVVVLEPASACR